MDFKNILTKLDQLNESVEVVAEKITKDMSAGDIIKDFQKSDDPKFKGKSKAERKKMALGAYYDMHPEKSNESLEEAELRRLAGLNEADEDSLMDKLQQIADGPEGEDDLLYRMERGYGEEGMFLRKLYDKVSNKMFGMDSGDLDDPEDFDKVHAEVMDMFGIKAEPLSSLQQKAQDRQFGDFEEGIVSDMKLSPEMQEKIKNASDEELNKMAFGTGDDSLRAGDDFEMLKKARAELRGQSEGFDRNAFRAAFEAMVESKKKADKDYDEDGRIESPEEEYKGSKDKAIKKAMSNKKTNEGKSPHKKGSKKYKDHMAAKHANMAESINESFEKFIGNEKMSFEDMVAVVKESGGQQQIDPVDEVLWSWANRVAASKGEDEMFAAKIYESNGGRFELYDVLNEQK